MSLTAPVMTESVLMRSLSIEKQNRQLTPVERKGGGGRWRGRVVERERKVKIEGRWRGREEDGERERVRGGREVERNGEEGERWRGRWRGMGGV